MNSRKKGAGSPFLSSIVESVRSEAERKKGVKGALGVDIGVFLFSFFLAGRHIAFGAYPLASAFVAVLPARVWIAAVGAVVGSLVMGRAGIIHATVTLIILLLRVVISSGARGDSERLFGEPLIMRLCAATIGAFSGAVCEMLIRGFSLSSVLFGIGGVGLTLAFALGFSGLFYSDVSAVDFLLGKRGIFLGVRENEARRRMIFSLSFSLSVLLLSVSLIKYDYFGISLAYLFSSAVTLFIAKRFGAQKGMAIGFISSLGISAIYSPGFAILGVTAGALYPYGIGYALLGGGILFSLWAAYVGGLVGFLSVFIELLVGGALVYGLLIKTTRESESEVVTPLLKTAEDMVGASWLSRKRDGGRVTSLAYSLRSAAERIRELHGKDTEADIEEYKRICLSVVEEEKIPKNEENIEIIATKLYKKEKITREEYEALSVTERASDKISMRVAAYEKSLYDRRRGGSSSEEYAYISRMISDSLAAEKESEAVNAPLTEAAGRVFSEMGFPDGCIKVFGEDRICVIGAGRDADGSIITSPLLKSALEQALGCRLGSYEYYRRGEMALFTASAAPSYTVDYATASASADGREPSGDSAAFFEGGTHFYAVISDGMGTGREARLSSDFVCAYLSDMLSAEVSVESTVASLGHLLRERETESSATMDLFSLCPLSGEAIFTKCGAAPSYVKRGKSIFRVRSESAPIGLMPTLDAERIRVEIKPGDTVIMVSDGVSASSSDAAWLLSFLAKADGLSAEECAVKILALAEKNSHSRDDMTVSVINVISK